MTSINSNKIAILIPDLGWGGAERVSVNLANELSRRGYQVDVVLRCAQGNFLADLNSKIKVINLNAKKLRFAFMPLLTYLRNEKPVAMIACMWPLTIFAVLARFLSGSKTRIVVAEHQAWTSGIKSYSKQHEYIVPWSMKLLFPFSDGIVTVSEDAAEDLVKFTGLPRNKVTAIYNPVIDSNISKSNILDSVPDSDWSKSKYRVLTVGTLKEQKNHELLIRSFSLLRQSIDANLLILGEGHLRDKMEALIEAHNLQGFVSMPGFSSDAKSYYLNANLFVLSSDYEGLPTVLIEALDSGTPIVSTNCPTGPREILEDGKFGILTPVGDAEALANAMLESLSKPHDKAMLKLRAQDFSISKATDKYLNLLLPKHQDETR